MFEKRRDRGWARLSMLGALVALITVFAVACGNDDDGGGDGGNGSEPTAAATTGGGDEGDSITIEAGQPIKIGISTTLTTDNAALGFPVRDGSLLAIKEKGTIKGFTVEGVAEDDLCDGPGSVTAAEKLISEDVVAVLGPMCSGGAVAAIPVYQEENLVTVSGSATGVAVTQQGSDSFFRTAWNDATQGAEMAKYAYETLGERTAVLVNDQSVYGQGLMTVFKDSWEELGGEIVSEEAVTVGEKDFSPVVTKISNDQPDIVVFGGFIAEGAVLVSQLKDAGVESTFMGADGVADQDFIDQSQGKAEGAYVSRGPTPTDNALYLAFGVAFEAEYGEPAGQFAEYCYDAANIIMAAIEEVGEVDADGNLVINKQDLLEAIRSADYAGASGQIQFNDVGDRVVAPGVVNRIDQVTNNALERLQ